MLLYVVEHALHLRDLPKEGFLDLLYHLTQFFCYKILINPKLIQKVDKKKETCYSIHAFLCTFISYTQFNITYHLMKRIALYTCNLYCVEQVDLHIQYLLKKLTVGNCTFTYTSYHMLEDKLESQISQCFSNLCSYLKWLFYSSL